jgi:hypothetical protein
MPRAGASRSLLCMRCAKTIPLIAACTFFGCAADEPAEVAGNDVPMGGFGGTSAGGTGGLSLDAGSSGSGGAGGSCGKFSVAAAVGKRPLDLVIHLDMSDSMGNAVNAVKASFDQSFSTVMEQSGVDYRVIMISNSSFVPNPADPSRYFHLQHSTGSGELPAVFLSLYDQWKQWSRPEALKALVAITDSGSGPTLTAQQFETKLFQELNLPGFGTPTDRNYRFHFISGFVGKQPPGAPWTALDPIVGQKACAKLGGNGQALAILTDGLRFSMCDYASYDKMFAKLAETEVALAPIACHFPVPDPAPGETIDPNEIEIVVSSPAGEVTLHQVHNATECQVGGFYVEGTEIVLCPTSCSTIQADPSAFLTVSYGCPTDYVPE